MVQADRVRLPTLVVLRRDHPHFRRDLSGDFLQHCHARSVDAIIVGQNYSVEHGRSPASLGAMLFAPCRSPRPGLKVAGNASPAQHCSRQRERTTMLIIDAQVHIWGSGKPSAHHRQTSIFTADELIKEMDEAGVNGAVLHPPSWDAGSNEMAIEAAKKYPDKFCALGWFPLDDLSQRKRIETWKQQPGMLGLRWSLTRSGQETWHEDGTMDWLWPAAEKAGTPIATMAWRFLPLFGQIAERHPNLKLIIDHLGVIRAAFANLDALLALAKHPNIAVKATGAPSHSSAPYPYKNIHDGLHRIYDAFGPNRFFWGTDITRMPCSYRECVTMFTEELPWLRGRDLEQVMGMGVVDWLGWKRST
jgi:predicted TIM-barrel fold metal-dependent hydrolase